jgi:hypothetical protein
MQKIKELKIKPKKHPRNKTVYYLNDFIDNGGLWIITESGSYDLTTGEVGD